MVPIRLLSCRLLVATALIQPPAPTTPPAGMTLVFSEGFTTSGFTSNFNTIVHTASVTFTPGSTGLAIRAANGSSNSHVRPNVYTSGDHMTSSTINLSGRGAWILRPGPKR